MNSREAVAGWGTTVLAIYVICSTLGSAVFRLCAIVITSRQWLLLCYFLIQGLAVALTFCLDGIVQAKARLRYLIRIPLILFGLTFFWISNARFTDRILGSGVADVDIPELYSQGFLAQCGALKFFLIGIFPSRSASN